MYASSNGYLRFETGFYNYMYSVESVERIKENQLIEMNLKRNFVEEPISL